VLNLAGDTEKRHFVATASWTFYLEVVAVVHPETLETLNEQEVDSCELGQAQRMQSIPSQIGPLQLLFPPNMPLLESAGQYSTLNSCPLTI